MGLDSTKFESGLNRAQKGLKRVSKQLTATGKRMTAGITAPLVGIAASSFKVAADFELAMKKVKAVSGATASDFKLLENSARELGASTVFSASQVAELQLEMAKLGLGAKEITAATGDTLALAQAFGTELGPTAEAVIKTINQFGLEAADAGKVSDIMATAFANSALDLEKFSGSMANAGPVAANFGFNLEETTALLGVLANSGIEGADAGTKLKMAFSKLAAEGVDVKETFSAIINGSLDYKDAIDVLGKRAAILSPIFGENLESLADLNEKFAESEGAAKGMAAEMDNSASGGIAAMKSAIEGAQITLGRSLAPTIMRIVKFVTELAQKFSALSKETQNTILVVGGLAAALGPALMAVGALASPLGIAAAAMGGLALGIAKVVSRTNSFQEKSQTLQGTLGEVNKKVAEQSGEAKVLFSRLKDVNTSEEDRIKTIAKLQEKYPDLLKNLDKNATNLDAIEAAERRVITAIKDRVRTQILADAEQAKLQAEVVLETRLQTAQITVATENPDINQRDLQVQAQFVRDQIEEFLSGEITGLQLESSLASVSFGVNEASDLLSEELGLTDLNSVTGGFFSSFKNDLLDVIQTTKSLENVQTILAGFEAESEIEVLKDGEDKKVEDLLQSLMKFGTTAEVVKKGAETVEDAAEDATSGLDELLAPTRTFADVSNDLAKAFEHIDEKVDVFEDFDAKGAKVAAITTAINELIDADIETPAGKLEELAEQLRQLQLPETTTELLDFLTKFGQSTENIEVEDSPLERLTKSIKEIQTLDELPFITELETTQALINAIEEAMRTSVLADPNFIDTEQFENLNNQLDTLKAKMEGLSETQEGLNETMDIGNQVGQMFGDIVTAGFDTAGEGAEAFQEAMRGIVMRLISQALATALSNAVASAFSPADPANATTGGLSGVAKAAALTATIGALFAGIKSFATGGLVLGPTLAMIGDNPSGREAVIPFERMGDFLGQVAGNNQNMNVTGKINGGDIILSHERALRQRGR